MNTIPSNVNNIYCPGCAPGDFPQPHICGLGNVSMQTGRCPLCGSSYVGYHVCSQPSTVPGTRPSPMATIVQHTAPATCDHCFCLKQKAGKHRVPEQGWPYDYYHLKRHQLCCMCGTRRVATQESAP